MVTVHTILTSTLGHLHVLIRFSFCYLKYVQLCEIKYNQYFEYNCAFKQFNNDIISVAFIIYKWYNFTIRQYPVVYLTTAQRRQNYNWQVVYPYSWESGNILSISVGRWQYCINVCGRMTMAAIDTIDDK